MMTPSTTSASAGTVGRFLVSNAETLVNIACRRPHSPPVKSCSTGVEREKTRETPSPPAALRATSRAV